MPDQELTTRILEAVDAGFDEQLAFTRELVRIPSLRGAEAPAQDFLAAAFRARGLVVDRWRVEVDAIRHLPGFSPVAVPYDNVIDVVGVHRASGARGRSLILNSHVDVVPTGPLEMWTTPPFEPRVEAGWLYGRGAGDMKAGTAAALFALDALRRCGYRPGSDLCLQSVVEEESTGNGTLACLARGYRADAVLIPEPEDDRLVRAQVGVMWLQIRLRGRPVHVREAGTGANAIEAAWAIAEALHGLEARWNAERHRHAHFAGLRHPINFNVGKIRGGDWPSSVPAWCAFDVRVAVYPGVDLAAARAEIEATIREAAARLGLGAGHLPEVAYHGFLAEGYVLTGADEAEGVLGGAHAVAFGRPLEEVVTPGTTDARFFGLYGGMPALVYGPVTENIHGCDERVKLDSVRRVTQVIALFVADWCGLEPA